MLSLNTLHVKAAGPANFNYSKSITFTPTSNGIRYPSSYTSYTQGGGSISSVKMGNSYSYEFEMPFVINSSWASMNLSGETGNYPSVKPWIAFSVFGSASCTASNGATVYNVYITDNTGKVVWMDTEYQSYFPYIYCNYTDYWSPNTAAGSRVPYTVHGFISAPNNFYDSISLTVTFSGNISAFYSTQENASQRVVESNSADIKNNTGQIKNDTSEIKTETHNFFSTFFSNLIGVFVPEDGFFTTWFNNLNSLLEAKLGILYYPFGKIIYFLNNLTTAFGGTASASFTFPAIEFTNQATGETYTFLSSQTVNLNDYNLPLSSSANSSLVGTTGYSSLIDIVRTFNGFVIVMLLLALLRQKLNLILRGDDNDS